MEKLGYNIISDTEDWLVAEKPRFSVISNKAYSEACLQRSLVVM